ncbi:High-affinity branched-chain amino acid transport system permease protein LivH [Nocardioides sp. AX2bis]|nr:High-affinity branched-chain amino acid transport system permease protein LivH [Nocardioides sp. AX2bis]
MQMLSRAWRHTLVRHATLAVLGLLVAVVVLMSVDDFRNRQLTELAYMALAAGGLTLLTGINGQISLGHGAFMAIGAYTTALLLQDPETALPLPLVLLASLLVALVVGVLVGVAAARLHGPYLAGATLTLAIAVPGIARYFSTTLGGEQGLRVTSPEPPAWFLDALFFLTGTEPSNSQYYAILGWTLLVVVFFLLANLIRGRVGRRWAAVRDDEVAAELAGINLARARVSAFTVSAAVAGLAGALMAIQIRLAAPTAFELTLSLTLLTAIVLGGLGTLSGAIIGSVVLVYTARIATDVGTAQGLDSIAAAELAPLVYGTVMILVILLAPAGLVGSLLRWRAARAARGADRRTTPPAARPTDPHHPDGPADQQRRPVATTKGDQP